MSHAHGFLSTAEALRNVFLPRACYALRPSRLPLPSLQYQFQISFKRRYAVGPSSYSLKIAGQPIENNRRSPNENQRNRDENIRSRFIHIVQPNGRLGDPQTLYSSIQSIDRAAYYIEQYGDVDGIPVCKIINKKEARIAAKARKKHKRPSAVTKYLELNWTIDKNDLAHRLAKLREFLEHGRRVEVFLSKKRKHTRNASEEEGWQTLESVQKFVKGIPGAKEIKPMDGQLLGKATLYFEGTAAQETGQDQKTMSESTDDTPAKQVAFG